MALPSLRDPKPDRNERSDSQRQERRSQADRYGSADHASDRTPDRASSRTSDRASERTQRSYSRNSISYDRSGRTRQDDYGYQDDYPDDSQDGYQDDYRESYLDNYGEARRDGYRTARPERYHAQHSRDRYGDYSRYMTKKKKRSIKGPLIALLIVAALGAGGYFYVQNMPITVSVNGQNQKIDGDKTIETVLSKGFANPQPGNFVAVDGSVIEEGKGELLSVSYNGDATTDFQTKLKNGDSVDIGNGANKVEDSQDTIETIPFETYEEGIGPLHVFEGTGVDGQRATKTGSISGVTITEDTVAVENVTYRKFYPDVGDDKVVALTFDDGPWPEYTQQILDILDKNNAKATFFVVGENFNTTNSPMVKKAYDSGHQISSHSYDHARGSGGSVNLGHMTAEEQVNEITKGYEAIRNVTGAEPSHILRAPGGNFDAGCQHTLRPYVDAEIGWSIDTQDWKQPGVEAIVDQIKAARTGDVILMHDGGGTREQTVEALKEALPYLKEKGFKFITIDEMLKYPPRG